MALAALIIKERLGVTNEECVEQIRENPYLQYLCGMKALSMDRPFHPTMLVHFRKWFPADVLKSMNGVIVARAAEKTVKDDDHDATKGSCGVYPASVHADRIYRTRDNLRCFKKHRIQLSGPSPRLGRPPKETPENAARLRAEAIQAHQDKLDREKCLL